LKGKQNMKFSFEGITHVLSCVTLDAVES